MTTRFEEPPLQFQQFAALVIGCLVLLSGVAVAAIFRAVAVLHSFSFAGYATASFLVVSGAQISLRTSETKFEAADTDLEDEALLSKPIEKPDLFDLSAAVIRAEEWLDTPERDSPLPEACANILPLEVPAPQFLSRLPYTSEAEVRVSASEFLRIAARIEEKVLAAYVSRFPGRLLPGSPVPAIEQLTDDKAYPLILTTAVKYFWAVRNSFALSNYGEDDSSNLPALIDLGLRLDFLLFVRTRKPF